MAAAERVCVILPLWRITAADLAYGIAFSADHVVEIDPRQGCTETNLTGCLFPTAISVGDLNEQPLSAFTEPS
jgi:hypothetical protein